MLQLDPWPTTFGNSAKNIIYYQIAKFAMLNKLYILPLYITPKKAKSYRINFFFPTISLAFYYL